MGYIIISLLIMAFIFSQSLQTGEKSSQISFTALRATLFVFRLPRIKKIKESTETKEDYHTIVRETYHPFHEKLRKLAHMAEFGALAVFVYESIAIDDVPTPYVLGSVLFIVLLTAVLDEFIQFFVPGRCSRVSDVLIDFAGGVLGIAFILAFHTVLNYIQM